MLNFLDVYERALDGPLMTENDFDMKVIVPTVREVVNAFGIKYDPENPLPTDDAAADNLYQAAVEFLSRVGVYCKDTNRVMQFSREEILAAVRTATGKCCLGEGKDAVVYGMRKPDDPRWPMFNVGFGWICTSEEMASNQIEALASGHVVRNERVGARDRGGDVGQVAVVHHLGVMWLDLDGLEPGLLQEDVWQHHVLVGDVAGGLHILFLRHRDHEIGFTDSPLWCRLWNSWSFGRRYAFGAVGGDPAEERLFFLGRE